MVIAAVTAHGMGGGVVPPGGAHHAHVRQSFQDSLESIAAGESFVTLLHPSVSFANAPVPLPRCLVSHLPLSPKPKRDDPLLDF